MTITIGDDNTVTETLPTMELRWELQNPEGVRARRWQLMQKYIVTIHRRIASNGLSEIFSREFEWRPVPISMPPDEIVDYSRAHAGFVPRTLDVEGELK